MPAKPIDVQDTALDPHFLITGDKPDKDNAKKHFNAYGQRPDKHSSVIPAPQPLARAKTRQHALRGRAKPPCPEAPAPKGAAVLLGQGLFPRGLWFISPPAYTAHPC